MARIRTIKPEFWESEKVGRMGHLARLTFMGLVSLADDEGRGRGSMSFLLGRLHSYADIGMDEFSAATSEIDAAGLAEWYEGPDSCQYYVLPGFKDNQYIERPSKSKIPAPPTTKNSGRAPRGLPERSPRAPRTFPSGKEGKGEEGKGSGKGTSLAATPPEGGAIGPSVPQRPLTPQQIIVRYFKEAKGVDADDKEWDKRHWNGRLGKDANAVLRAFAGDAKKAGEYILVKGLEWEHLPDWGLNGVVAAAGRDPRLIGGEHGRTDDEVGADRLDGPGRHRGTASSRAVVGETVRAIEQSRVRPEGPGDVDGPGEDSRLHDEEFA